jgi:hypothetical protein
MTDERKDPQLGFDDLDDLDDLPADEAETLEPAAPESHTPEPDVPEREPEAAVETKPVIPSRLEVRRPAPREAVRDFDTPPAPVVTDEGVYGTLPPPRRTLRDYESPERSARETWSRSAGIFFALLAAAWLILYSTAQATGETVALPAIERTVDSLTGLEGLLVLQEDAIRAITEEPVVVPGFEITGATLAQSEVASGSPAEWHALLLERASRSIYTSGTNVMAPSGEQSDGGAFSTSGGAMLLMNTLSESNHSLAVAVLVPLAGAAGIALLALLALGSPFGRFQTTGFGLLMGATPAIIVGVLGIGLIAFIGTDGSALAEETHDIASEVVRIPLRNGLTVLVAGLAIAIPARLVGVFFARSRRAEAFAD